ncbi:MAG: 5-(carboxyamino)imidazole ribonucleotide mutase [Bacteroidota bacterium]|nr:5-(carboxyamino)imidazole ribonucleotide mutase [Bacteroidota bacterium]
MSDVLIIMGSDSDLPVMKEAAIVLEELNINYIVTIVSAHRTPKRMFEEAQNAKSKGFKCIIAGAGGAAHLPGMTASLTELPVIGVPIKTSTLSGIDSLYSIVQMPPGIPVATMAIDGARNAGLFAAKIIALSDENVAKRLTRLLKKLEETILDKASKLEDLGYEKYLLRK